MAYDNTNTGFMARSERKRNDKDPDFSGSIEVGNPSVQFWLAGWINEGKAGSKMEGKRYFSLKFTPKDAPRAAAPRDDDDTPTPIQSAPIETPPIPYRPPAVAKSQVDRELDEETIPF